MWIRRNSTHSILLASAFVAGMTLSINANASSKPLPRQNSDQSSADTAGDENVAITGLWHVKFLAGGQTFDEGFDLWNSDGTEILNDIAPPQPANGSGTICLGVFKTVGPRTYKLRHPFWIIDTNGNLAGTGVILEQVTVALTGNSYTGSLTAITYDLGGNITSQTTGEIQAQRVTVD